MPSGLKTSKRKFEHLQINDNICFDKNTQWRKVAGVSAGPKGMWCECLCADGYECVVMSWMWVTCKLAMDSCNEKKACQAEMWKKITKK